MAKKAICEFVMISVIVRVGPDRRDRNMRWEALKTLCGFDSSEIISGGFRPSLII